MKRLIVLLVVASLGACSTASSLSQPQRESAREIVETHDTVLFVSLEDGSVIRQTIASDADYCFKNSFDSATTCLTQGAAMVDPDTNVVIGFEMREGHIDLIAK